MHFAALPTAWVSGFDNAAILKRLAEIDKTLLMHEGALRDIYEKLLPLLAFQNTSPRWRALKKSAAGRTCTLSN
jgi:hypothetical protein